MKKKNEKGITGIDAVIGLTIFVMASSVILTMYYNLYVISVTMKIHETAVGIITDIFEKIDLEDYDNITEAGIETIINNSGANEYFNEEKNHSKVTYDLIRYTDINTEAEDLVKKINIKILYQVNGKEGYVSMKKLKIREQI